MYEKAKGNKGPGEPTGINLNDFDKMEEPTNTTNNHQVKDNPTNSASDESPTKKATSMLSKSLSQKNGAILPPSPLTGGGAPMTPEQAKVALKNAVIIAAAVLAISTDGATLPLIRLAF